MLNIKDLDSIILHHLDDKSLSNVFKVNKSFANIKKDPFFWLSHIKFRFPYLPLEIINEYKIYHNTYFNYYLDIRKINIKNKERYLRTGSFGRLDYIIITLKLGVKIQSDDFNTAARNGKLNVVTFLINEGIFNVHLQDDYALRYASLNGHIDVVKYLIEKGAYVDTMENFALRWASYYGHLDVVKLLVENGANIYVRNKEPIRNAKDNDHLEVFNYLLSLLYLDKEKEKRIKR